MIYYKLKHIKKMLYARCIMVFLIHTDSKSARAINKEDDYFNHGQYALPEFIVHRDLVSTPWSTTETTTLLPWVTLSLTSSTRRKKTTTPLDTGQTKFFVLERLNASAIFTLEGMTTTIPTTTMPPYMTGYISKQPLTTDDFTVSNDSTPPDYPSEPIVVTETTTRPTSESFDYRNINVLTKSTTRTTTKTLYYTPPKTPRVTASNVIKNSSVITKDMKTVVTVATTNISKGSEPPTTLISRDKGNQHFADLTRNKRVMRNKPSDETNAPSVVNNETTSVKTTSDSGLPENETRGVLNSTESTTTEARGSDYVLKNESREAITFSFIQTTTAKYEEIIEYEELTTDPFSKFLELLLLRMAKMNDTHAGMFLRRLRSRLVHLVNDGRFNHFGPVTPMYIQDCASMVEAPLDQLKRMLAMSYNAMAHRRKVISDEVNSLLDFVDMVYTPEEEEKMERVLNETTAYPNVSKSHKDIVDGFLDDVILAPSRRISGTTNGKILFDSITNIIRVRHPTEYHVRRHENRGKNYLDIERKLKIIKDMNKEFIRKNKRGRLKFSNRRHYGRKLKDTDKTKRNIGLAAKRAAPSEKRWIRHNINMASHKKTLYTLGNRRWRGRRYEIIPIASRKYTKIITKSKQLKGKMKYSSLQSSSEDKLLTKRRTKDVKTIYKSNEKNERTSDSEKNKHHIKIGNQKGDRLRSSNLIRQRGQYNKNNNNFVSVPTTPGNNLPVRQYNMSNQNNNVKQEYYKTQSTTMLQTFYKQVPKVYHPMGTTRMYHVNESKTRIFGNNKGIYKYEVTIPVREYGQFSPKPVERKAEDREFMTFGKNNLPRVLDFSMKLEFNKQPIRLLNEGKNAASINFQEHNPKIVPDKTQTVTWDPPKKGALENHEVTDSNETAATAAYSDNSDNSLSDIVFSKGGELEMEDPDESESTKINRNRNKKEQKTFPKKYEWHYYKRKHDKHSHRKHKQGRHETYKRIKSRSARQKLRNHHRDYIRKKKRRRKHKRHNQKRYNHHRVPSMKFNMDNNNKNRYKVETGKHKNVIRDKNNAHHKPFIKRTRDAYTQTLYKHTETHYTSYNFYNSDAERAEKYENNESIKDRNEVGYTKKYYKIRKEPSIGHMDATRTSLQNFEHNYKGNGYNKKTYTLKINNKNANKIKDTQYSYISKENTIKKYNSDRLHIQSTSKNKIKNKNSKHFVNKPGIKEELVNKKPNEVLPSDYFDSSDGAQEVTENVDKYMKKKSNSLKKMETVYEKRFTISTSSHKINTFYEKPPDLEADEINANQVNLMQAYSDLDNLRRNRPKVIKSITGQKPRKNLLLESEYSDDEKELKNNLYDAFRHGDFREFRRNIKHDFTQKVVLTDESEYTDMEIVLKEKIYKAIKKMI